MKSVNHRLIPAAVFALFTCIALHAEELTWDHDFSRGLRGWMLGRASTLKREGAMMFVRLRGPKGNGIAGCKSPVVKLDGAAHEFDLTCTYRTDVQHSHLHGGAWFVFYKLDGDEKLVGDWTGLPLKEDADWATATTTVRIPEGTKRFQAGIRVQGREGKTLDVRTVSLKKLR